MEPFSAVLMGAGALSSFFGSSDAARQAENQMAMQADALALQRRQSELASSLAVQELEYQRWLNDIQLGQNQFNQQQALNAFDYYRQLQASDRSQQQAEQDYFRDRQTHYDQLAANQRAFDIEQLLQNQQLTADQRQYAIDQFDWAKGIAAGERQTDLDNYNAALQQLLDERNYDIQRQTLLDSQAQGERQFMLDERSRIQGLTDDLATELDALRTRLGALPTANRYTEADVESEAQDRWATYQANVDRAADRIGSINEAAMISGGIDASTTGATRRAEVASRMADEYNNAYVRAYDDAAKYIGGLQQIENTGVQQAIQERMASVDEIIKANGTVLNYNMNLPNAPSAMSPTINTTSAAYDRNIQSALTGAPVNIGSGVYTQPVSQGYASQINIPSAAGFQYSGDGTASTQIPGTQLGALINAATNSTNAFVNNSGNLANTYTNMANNQASQLGSILADFTRQGMNGQPSMASQSRDWMSNAWS
ncbi:hypothetical protein GCM10023116_48340 [Kistimonas scapharcae]|uniref:Uncharacterized protein n=1 Tax=Kistimonas scapharcae TaxID=1036133 RepID=A0ABP8VC09_9GAMM